jgi:hypothetical protein
MGRWTHAPEFWESVIKPFKDVKDPSIDHHIEVHEKENVKMKPLRISSASSMPRP